MTNEVMAASKVCATLLLRMLSELFENLPEVGDVPKPKLVFFFDEAHLLFTDLSGALLEKIEQVVRLIRSKGVGVYFVTQNPRDVPDTVLGQLGNRVQHALRAFTPADQKLIKAAAETFRANPKLDTASVLTELGVGEALVSLLDERGQPCIVERAFIVPPRSQIGPIRPEQRQALMANSVVAGFYERVVDRESAYERLTGAVSASGGQTQAPPVQEEKRGFFATIFGGGGNEPAPAPPPALPTVSRRPVGRQPDDFATMIAKSATRTVTTAIVGGLTRQIMRGVLGGIMGGRRR